MPSDSQIAEYEPLRPRRRAARADEPDSLRSSSARAEEDDDDPASVRPARREEQPSIHADASLPARHRSFSAHDDDAPAARIVNADTSATAAIDDTAARDKSLARDKALPLKSGHGLAFAGLFLFTFVVYFRPYEIVTALMPISNWLAFSLAAATAFAYFPAQLGLEGNFTAPLREVKLVLLLCLFGLFSVPLAINRGEAWDEFVGYSKVVLMFVVMINVVRTERRLRQLVILLLAASVMLSVGAFIDYRAGRFTTGGDRIAGMVGGMFGNPNDLAMHLATMMPLAFALSLTARPLKKFLYLAVALLMTVAVVLTFSRGGFLGLAAAALVLAWKLGRRHRVLVAVATVASLVMFLALAPADYTERLTSIVDMARDAHGSAMARQAVLVRSVKNILMHPLFGVGMGNFHIVSIGEQVSHNAYTQVGAEIGVPALLAYVLLLFAPLRRLRRVERETLPLKHGRDYYWAVSLQASLAAYIVSSFFGSVAYLWYIYYLVAFGVCFHRIYESRKLTAEAQAARDLTGSSSATTLAGDAPDSRVVGVETPAAGAGEAFGMSL
jgi:O-antigen ligase